MPPRSPLCAAFLAVIALGATAPAAAQTFSCNLSSPASIQPGQSITLTFSATNTGSTVTSTGGSNDSVLIALSVALTPPTVLSSVYPHIHVSNVRSGDPQLDLCFTTKDNVSSVGAECFNNVGHTTTIAPGAVESISLTFQVDAGTPAASAIVVGSIQQNVTSFCEPINPLAIGGTCNVTASAPAISQSGQPYTLQWTATMPPANSYAIDESTTADFTSGVNTQTTPSTSQNFQHSVSTATAYYYRVHAADCGGSAGPNSPAVKVIVQGSPQPATTSADVVVPFRSTTPVSFPLIVNAPAGGKTALDTGFTASTDKGFVSVTPTSGSIPTGGSTTLTVTANPSNLPPGANTGTVTVTSSGGSTIASVPVSISLVTPVTPGGTSGVPPANTLILPVITHVNGSGIVFESDVRLTNASLSDVTYHLTLTPTRSDGTQVGVQTVVPVTAGQTIAMNDIAKDFFGYGATGAAGDQGFGSLQIRPDTATALTFASSRTYATNASGTFGQFIPATPFSSFAVQGQALSLQHVAHSSAFRTNLGIVEGSGSPAGGRARIIDDNGVVLQSVPFMLQAGEHQQLNGFIAANGIPSLDDGRIELIVDSATGAVSGYASVLDNVTQDPYAVAPVRASTISATRYITPGVAEVNNGAANFHSDLRIFNGGSTSQLVSLTYYPQGAPGSPITAPAVNIGAGQVKAINNVLPTAFNVANSGGSILMTTAAPSSLVTTVRTYSNAASGGTFGQFIPGVSPSNGVGVGDRGLQVLQLEQSAAFRSNIGIVELNGNPAHVRMTLVLPDSKTAPVLEFDLAANEFKQFGSVISSMNPGQNTYNARMTVEVTSGSGRVTAYGSVIDNRTQDPTYVPAQ